jgi:recombination protein RecA
MSSFQVHHHHVFRLDPSLKNQALPQFGLAQVSGRLVELSARGAAATLSAVTQLMVEAQDDLEPVVWIGLPSSSFYPPDLIDGGVDLEALVVVRAPDAIALGRAAERLLRSGAFGLVVLDLGSHGELPVAHQGRLGSLAQKYDAAVVCLTEKSRDASSLGSLISLRVEALRVRKGGELGYGLRALKDKQRGPGWEDWKPVRAPAGLRIS